MRSWLCRPLRVRADHHTEVMVLCTDIVKADGHLAEGELQMLDSLAGTWARRFDPAVSMASLPESTV